MSGFRNPELRRIFCFGLAVYLLLFISFLPGLHTCRDQFASHAREEPATAPRLDAANGAGGHLGSHDHETCPACQFQAQSRGALVVFAFEIAEPAPALPNVLASGECPVFRHALLTVLPRAPPTSPSA